MQRQLAAILAVLSLLTMLSIRVVAAERAAVTGVTLPADYRSWEAAAPSLRTDKNIIRLMLVNPIMAQAYKKGTLPFPEGSMIAKLTYEATKSPTWEAALVPGASKGVEIMVKDSKRFPQNQGWGFGSFAPDGTPVGDGKHYVNCFPCHEASATKSFDYIFTHWAP